MKKKLLLVFSLYLLVSISISCNPINEKNTVEQRVLEFRQRIKNKEFEKTYEQASLRFRQATNKVDFISALSKMSSEIGEPGNFTLESWKVNNDLINGTQVILIYKSKKEDKIALEEYVFVKEREDWLLFNYRFDIKQ